MNLNQLTIEYLRAQANENKAFYAIEGTGTGEQWDVYFDAQAEARIALEAMLCRTLDIVLRMTEDEDNRKKVTSFFYAAINRGGDVREKAIEKAFELATLMGGATTPKH